MRGFAAATTPVAIVILIKSRLVTLATDCRLKLI
jgi:hypothetical protein